MKIRKFLRKIIAILLFRIDWKKLVFIGAILTVFRIMFQISTLPYPLTEWILFPPSDISSSRNLNDEKNLRELPASQDIRFNLSQHAPLVVSLNATARLSETQQVLERREQVSRQRKSRKHVNAVDKVIFSSSPVRNMSNHMLRYIASLTPDEALAYAKQEIENAPLVTDDQDLYTPLFRNVSVFKRSYELMELILKVYIYKEGKRPIFHQPYLRGIYSSEGWFMKLMEDSRQFVTRDPQKAHLFYLPYSARQLQKARYVVNSHDLKPLSVFLRNYVNMLASKYPFWNRTRGSDHFLVACHDWGPYTLKDHEELSRNTIKALCNADISEGIFVSGKDVSLPETTIRNPRRPLRNLGGKRVSQRPILAFFAGNMHGPVRPKLLKYWRDKDESIRIYGPLPHRVSKVMSYPEHMKSSKYCLCPMGYEVNSPRIVEAIYYECVPVIIADNFALPFSEVLNWTAFSVVVSEKDIPRLKEILLSIPLRRYQVMQNNVKMLQKHFIWNSKPTRYDLFHMILHSIWVSRLNQLQVSQIS
ncbi:probable glycosyltransferase At5g25310 [Solanum tuberosum]|uniref:Exostosin family protein n=2 Tax=Solanum tuberosum TaxID=4113 RepID=M1AXL5_SOLTU|nr:PREDICTED: probable glycosyltransferase At5g25310 [Solanum tuberosum]XP_006358343.1 PREDICTED: probable glycosyltransferase At5g25310 [Solanum tuberosum]XP_006358344.1 PREDICTED: probable glycosyltransferase At5g25310 [Solanum tuberosum]XP_015169383.1 PREDICTED: probable glycosyltransferase At5g25310 [Solanum tuberosum]XP_015169384.1 PREDICTED: probable glycosyltransferase At5g25310 [Solanum tuberosum]